MSGEFTDWLSAFGSICSAGAAVAAWLAVREANRLTKKLHANAESDAMDTLLERFDRESSRLETRIAIAEDLIREKERASRGRAMGDSALAITKALQASGVLDHMKVVERAQSRLEESKRHATVPCTQDSLRTALRIIGKCEQPVDALIERIRELRRV